MSVSGDEVCRAQSIIDACKEPLIGLQYVTEFRLQSGNSAQWYVCNLCEVKCSYKVIQSHVISTKHRINYMRERFMNYHTMIYQLAKTNAEKNSLAAEYAASIELEEGRQKIRMKISETAKGVASLAEKRSLEENDDSHETSPKIQKITNAQSQSAKSQSVNDNTAALMTSEIACSPKLQTVSRRINFVGSGPRQEVDRCNFISKQNKQESWLETGRPDLPSSQNIKSKTLSSDVESGSQMSANRETAVPLMSCSSSRRSNLFSGAETATALPLKGHSVLPPYSGPASNLDHNKMAKVASNSTGDASSSPAQVVALMSLPVPARHPFAQNVNRTWNESGFVDRPRLASSYSNSRMELIACLDELRSRPVPPHPSASVLRGVCRPSGVKLAAPPSVNSSSLPLRTSTPVQGNGTSYESLANTRPPLLPLRTPVDSTRFHSRLRLPSAGNLMPVNNRPLPSESSTTVKPLSNYSCTIPEASGKSSFNASIGRCRAETSNSEIMSHSNFSRYSNSNSLHNLSANQSDSNIRNSLIKSSGNTIYTDCTRPLTTIPRQEVPQSNTGTCRTYSSTSAIREPVSLSAASNSLACISEKHNSTFAMSALDSRNIDLGQKEASNPLYRHEQHKKNFALEAAAIVNHNPFSNSSIGSRLGITRSLVHNEKIEELKSTSSAKQTAPLSKTCTVGSQTKDMTHSTQSSMSAISSALAKALVEYQLMKKQKNDTVQ